MLAALPAQVTPSEEVLFQVLDHESVLLDIQSGVYFSLDQVAGRMWELLDEHPDPEAVVAVLLEQYEVDEDTLRSDLGRLIDELAEAKLVTVEAR